VRIDVDDQRTAKSKVLNGFAMIFSRARGGKRRVDSGKEIYVGLAEEVINVRLREVFVGETIDVSVTPTHREAFHVFLRWCRGVNQQVHRRENSPIHSPYCRYLQILSSFFVKKSPEKKHPSNDASELER
jgi:hypothetical protein